MKLLECAHGGRVTTKLTVVPESCLLNLPPPSYHADRSSPLGRLKWNTKPEGQKGGNTERKIGRKREKEVTE